MIKRDYSNIMIAKTGDNGCSWLPLNIHLLDTTGIMRYLIDDFISESMFDSLELDKEIITNIALFVSYLHDIGKVTVGFQYKIGLNLEIRKLAIEKEGLIFPDYMDSSQMRIIPHALAGECILNYFNVPKSISSIVGAHHGVPTGKGAIKDSDLKKRRQDIVGYKIFFGDDDNNKKFLEKVWSDIIGKALKISNIKEIKELPELSMTTQMLISGLLIMADWLASNTYFFPLIDVDSYGEDEYLSRRVDNAWENIGFTEVWKPTKDYYNDYQFEKNFGFFPNSIQKKILEIASQLDKPGIFILEAPMGCGKTEAALSLAEVVAKKTNKNGIFFGLPTQATTNGIFPRIKTWAEKQSDEFYHSIQLKHGNSEYNELFKKIQRGIPEEESDSGLIVHSWFCDNKKACLADFVVATVDQLLMMALKRKHVMLLHIGLSEKVIVIDEVHAYDSYMNQYMERALMWLGKYKTPVILLSATLTKERRSSLIKAYLGIKEVELENETNYPMLTWTDNEKVYNNSIDYLGVNNSIKLFKCKDDNIIEIVNRAVDGNCCIGIIMNTVARAQKIAEKVRNLITEKVILYHAQYIMPDRTIKEDEIIKRTGKKSNYNNRKGLVVVGTQVLEQSLDIDFDVLITDICPIDLLLQRIGRLQRHERKDRPVVTPICHIVMDEYDNNDTGSKLIYGSWLLKQTIENIPEIISIPKDISSLVQKVYDVKNDSDEYQEYLKRIDYLKKKAMSFLLKKPNKQDIHGLLDISISGDDTMAEASVRDGESSLEILLLKINDDGLIQLINSNIVLERLGESEAEIIALQKIRLPSKICNKYNEEKIIKEIQEKSNPIVNKWKRFYCLEGKLILFLDEKNEAILNNYIIKYSYENGLTCKGSDKE